MDTQLRDPHAPADPAVLPPGLARAHRWIRGQGWLRRFTWATRILLAIAFVPTGLVKLLGEPFTLLGTDNAVGHFFDALYRTGIWWRFLGLVQLTAAVLLLIPRTTAIGAVLFAPIGINIFLITVGIGFAGTVWVTGFMLLAVAWLLCWDAERIARALRPLVASPPRTGRREGLLVDLHPVETLGWVVGGATGVAFLLVGLRALTAAATPVLLAVGAGAVLLVVVGWCLAACRLRRPDRGPG